MIKFPKRRIPAMLLAGATLFSMQAPAALAQGGGSSLMLEEVIVTARKRAESLQDTPIAVSALSGDALRDAGITNLGDITELVPNLQITRPSKDANVYIRGVGPARGATNVTELSVGVYIDDVFLLKPYGQLIDLADIELIQVLRGPQGTLFGKNTTGGAMMVTTKKPEEEFGGYGEVTMGNDGRLNVQGSVNVPLTDSLLSKLTVTSVKSDGFFQDPINGDELSDEDRLGALLQLRWFASDDVTADFSFYHNRIRENGLAQGDCVVTNPEAEISGNALIAPTTGFKLLSDFCEEVSSVHGGRAPYYTSPEYELDASQASLNVSWDINANHNLKSITAWQNQEVPNIKTTNTSGGYPWGTRAITDGDSTQISQEFQLSGEFMDSTLGYTFGLYYMQDDTDTGLVETFWGEDGIWGSIAPPTPAGLVAALVNYEKESQEFDNTTYAVYTQWSWSATENLELTAGLRYGYEQRELDSSLATAADPWEAYADVPGAIIIPGTAALMTYDTFFGMSTSALPLLLNDVETLSADDSFESLTPMFSAAYSFPDSMLHDSIDGLMVYASYTEGYKAGGFSDFGIGELLPFDEEDISSVEIGAKLDAWDNRLRLNAAFFAMEYDDMQLLVARPDPDPLLVKSNIGVTNAGASSIDGVELEMTLLPAAGWMVNIAASFTDGGFDEFDDYIADSETGEPIPLDRSDEDMPSLPESSFSLGVQYEWDSNVGSWMARLDAYYRDEMYWGFDALTWDIPLARKESTSESFTIYNARLNWQINDALSVSAWGKNLADKTYYDGGTGEATSLGLVMKSFAAPRRYGIDLRYNF